MKVAARMEVNLGIRTQRRRDGGMKQLKGGDGRWTDGWRDLEGRERGTDEWWDLEERDGGKDSEGGQGREGGRERCRQTGKVED